MFEKLKKKIEQRARNEAARDPELKELLDRDPIAARTEWTPAAGGGANFKTRTLVQSRPDRVTFEATFISKALPLGFMLMGTLPLLIVFNSGFFDIFQIVFGGAFMAGGAILYRVFTKPITFDRTLGLYWRGKREPYDSSADGVVRLQEIHAIQLIRESVRSSSSSGRSSSYNSYELNLVLKDGERINVIDHGKVQVIRQDAELLGDFIGVPVWDAIWRGPHVSWDGRLRLKLSYDLLTTRWEHTDVITAFGLMNTTEERLHLNLFKDRAPDADPLTLEGDLASPKSCTR